MNRNKTIVRTSIIAILMNLVLVAAKMIVGMISGSIAIVLDAVNNLGDALSSIITIFGTKLASIVPDKDHPYGYGRIEYITAVIVSAIVLAAGVTSLKESVLKIIHPEAAEYTVVTLIVLVIGIVAKFVCGRYVKGVGEKIDASSLIASGEDALNDCFLSLSTLVAAFISIFFHLSVEGIVGALISVMIVKAGLEMLKDTLDDIIGVRADGTLTKQIKADIRTVPGVRGAYDLVLHNYGPEDMIASVHVEIADTATAQEIHRITMDIQMLMMAKYGIETTVGIYAANETGEYIREIRHIVAGVVSKHQEILQMHGLYADEEKKIISFDILMDFKVDSQAIKQQVLDELKDKLSDYTIIVNIDTSYTD